MKYAVKNENPSCNTKSLQANKKKDHYAKVCLVEEAESEYI